MDHFDGRRFFNPHAMMPTAMRAPREMLAHTPGGSHRVRSILKWQLGDRPQWPSWISDPEPEGNPHDEPAPGTVAVTLIGHASFLLRIGRAGLPPFTVITDPIFSDRCSPFTRLGPRRRRAPGRTLAELPRIDLVLVSHCHYDHLDLPSLRAIEARDAPAVITLIGNARHIRKAGMRRIVERDWWEGVTLDGLHISAAPARHGSARTPFDRNRALWGSFMIRADVDAPAIPSIFFAGDSADGQHWHWIRTRFGAPDLALLPVGAYDPRALMRNVHVNPEEAVGAFLTLGARQAVPMHYGTFQLTDEPIDEPLERTLAACVAADIDPARFAPLPFGSTRIFDFPRTVAVPAEAQERKTA